VREELLEEIAEMKDNGIYIGSHTKTHPVYHDVCQDDKVYGEIPASAVYIGEKLGGEVKVFAFPEGVYNSKALETVKNNGYYLQTFYR